MIICTSICYNYLPKAAVLAKSVKENNPNAKVIICLVENTIKDIPENYQSNFNEIVLAKDLGFNDVNFDSFIFKHSIVEASTAVKGQLFKYLFSKYKDENNFVYLDPDIRVYDSFDYLERILEENRIILTPHMIDQEDNNNVDAIIDNELCSLKYGVFNLGFLAVSRGEETYRFIDWWNSRLQLYCFSDQFSEGLFTDQAWMNLAPCFFNIYILKHSGFNVAPWNLSKRKINMVNNKYFVNGEPLVFFHYSGFDSGANKAMINKYAPDALDPIHSLRKGYVSELDNAEKHLNGNLRWSYEFFNNGEKIENKTRVIYRENFSIMEWTKLNPFNKNNSFFLNMKPNINSKKTYIWGTGDGGNKTYDYYSQDGMRINGWVDSDKNKWGTKKLGLTIYSPIEIIKKVQQNEAFIIIGSSYFVEIINKLKQFELEYMEDFLVSEQVNLVIK